MQKIMFVCVGNICRSPMAEGLLRDYFKKNNIEAVCTSTGIGALSGSPAQEHSQEIMHENGIDISKHVAEQISNYSIMAADLILVMEEGHKKIIMKMCPQARGRVFCLGKWRNIDIDDPYKQDKSKFVECFNLISNCLEDWEAKLWKKSAKSPA